MTYWRFCEGLIDPVASSGVLDQLHARPIFSLISDTPEVKVCVFVLAGGG